MLPLRSSLALAALLALGGLAQDEPTAPDGRPGLGTTRTVAEYATLLRAKDGEASELIAGLRGLSGEIGVLLAGLQNEAREAGYFALLEPGITPDLAGLRACCALLLADPLPTLAAGGERAEVLARAWLDLGLRLRLEASEGYEQEARDVRAGLALLHGLNDGFVDLRETEAREVARRVDLSAALLRAMRLDLEALQPSGDDGPGRPEPAWVSELLAVARQTDADERAAGFDGIRRKLDARAERLRAGLFSQPLRERLAPVLGQRAAGRDEAQRRLNELLPLVPETEQGREPPPAIEELPKNQRYALALRFAVEGLAFDVLESDLCYWAGLSSDFTRTRLESRAWFDRYLALRGIRAHDERTYRASSTGRELSEMEEYALAIVQQTGPLGR